MSEMGKVREMVDSLIGLAVIEARISPMGGDFLNIELEGHGRVRTEMAPWRLETEDEFIVACEDDRELIRGFITELDGARVSAVRVSPFLDLLIDFGGVYLVVNVVSTQCSEFHWAVQLSGGISVIAGPGRCWSLTRA